MKNADEVRWCPRCEGWLSTGEFSVGRQICNSCRREEAREYRRRYYQQNKEKVLAAKKVYESANREAVLRYQADYRAKKKEEKLEKQL